MSLLEKIATLTQEQHEKILEVKTSEDLEKFLTKTGLRLTEEEKSQIHNYVNTGLAELSDDELDNAAGGHGGMCHDKKGREIVTLITNCVHGLKEKQHIYNTSMSGMGDMTINYQGYREALIICGDARGHGGGGPSEKVQGQYQKAGSNQCIYLSYEKGIWYCNYNRR